MIRNINMFLRFGIHEMKKMKDYYDLYLKRDALLLAVFQKFRNNSLKIYGLCPGHYWSAAALSWDAMLNMRAAELELTSDVNMYLFFETGERDGVSHISRI